MMTFDTYVDYIKKSFSEYKNIIVETKVKTNDLLIVEIHSNCQTPDGKNGFLFIKFDQDTINFFGDFIPDEFVDEFDNTWEKYSEKEIFEILNKKIVEYKNCIDHGYFIKFIDFEAKIQLSTAALYIGNFDDFDYKQFYIQNNLFNQKQYNEIKSVTVTNFYGKIIVDNKVLN